MRTCYSQNTSLIYPPQSFSKHSSQTVLQFKCGLGQGATFQLSSSVAHNLKPKPCNWSCFSPTERTYDILLIITLSFLCLRVIARSPSRRPNNISRTHGHPTASKQARFTPSILRVIVTLLSPRSYSLLFFGTDGVKILRYRRLFS